MLIAMIKFSFLSIPIMSYAKRFPPIKLTKLKWFVKWENITDVIHSKYSKTFPSKIREIATWHNLCYNMHRYNVFELITSRSITINRCCLSFSWKEFHTKVMVILDMSKNAGLSRWKTWKWLPNNLFPLYNSS